MSRDQPEGREQVVDALLGAATDLFAKRGPSAVAVREIAARARVNHGLVHRHFGSKDALVRAVLDRLLVGMRSAFSVGPSLPRARRDLIEAVAREQRYWKILARALLDGQKRWLKDADFPIVRAAIEGVRLAQERGEVPKRWDARELVASYIALVLGWLVFEPFIVAATGLTAPSPELRRRMAELWQDVEQRMSD
jgi:AcrR family transcriptional regulator